MLPYDLAHFCCHNGLKQRLARMTLNGYNVGMKLLGCRLSSGLAAIVVIGCHDYTCADTASCVAASGDNQSSSEVLDASASSQLDAGIVTDANPHSAEATSSAERPSDRTRTSSAEIVEESTSAQDRPSTIAEDTGLTSIPALESSSVEVSPSADTSESSSEPPPRPPVTMGQAAELVLGQSDFETVAAGNGSSMFASASSLCSDGARLWVLDLANSRVVQFNAQPIANKQQADMAIGQPSLVEYTDGPSTPNLKKPSDFYKRDTIGDVFSDGRVLAVADGANRVLIWRNVPREHGAPWDVILGQADDSSEQPGLGASKLSGPEGVWTDGERVIVADSLNHRVLIWETLPLVNGQPADLVLGQADFESKEAPEPPTGFSMNHPSDVLFDGQRLFVSDSQNNRVLVWNEFPTESGTPADYAVGQASLETANCHAGAESANEIGLCGPGQLATAAHRIFIADRANFRVVVHTPVPLMSGSAAVSVLGAVDFSGAEVAEPQRITPRGVAVFGTKLFVSDSSVANGRSRVLRYQLAE